MACDAEDPTVFSHNSSSPFERLFLTHYRGVVQVLCRLLGDRNLAEDLASEVFWKVYCRPELLRGDGRLGGWLYRTAINLGIDSLRSDQRRRLYEREAGMEAAGRQTGRDPLEELLAEERRERVRKVLSRLKPRHAQILLLRSSGASYRELGEALRIKRGSVGTTLLRAEAEFEKRYRQLYAVREEL